MICPECDGIGIVRVRFLLFFTRRVRCSTCLGSGEFPPSAVRTSVRSRRSYRDDDDDDNRWPIATTPSTVTGADAGDDEPLEVGGGASGGAGGGASWDASASEERDTPVIADPFASALPDEPPLERDDSSSSMRDDSSSDSFSDSSSDSPSESSGSDSGTSY